MWDNYTAYIILPTRELEFSYFLNLRKFYVRTNGGLIHCLFMQRGAQYPK